MLWSLKSRKNGELGDIISVETQMNCIHPKKVRQWLENFPGGMMFFLGCHLIDLIYSIQGVPKKIIPLNKCSGIDDVAAEDLGMTVFEYENGISFAKTSAVEMGGYERRQRAVYDRYEKMMRSFAKMVNGEKENPWSYDYELGLYKIIVQAYGVYNKN